MTDAEIALLVRRLVAGVSTTDPDRPPAAAGPATAVPAAAGTSRAAAVDGPVERPVDELAEEALTGVLGSRPVRDDDGDIGIRLEHTVLFLHRASDGPVPMIGMYAPLRVAVPASPVLLDHLNELNAQHRLLRVVHRHDEVQLVSEMLCDPFLPAQLSCLVRSAAVAADALTGALAVAGHPGRAPLAAPDPAPDAAPAPAVRSMPAEPAGPRATGGTDQGLHRTGTAGGGCGARIGMYL